jgi:outer membrane lipoprotein-sorting protein
MAAVPCATVLRPRCVRQAVGDDSPPMAMRKTTTAIALLLVMAAIGAAESGGASDALLATIAEANQAHRSMQGRLTQRTRRLDEPDTVARVQQVQVFVVFPDHYCVVFTKPGDEDMRTIMLSDGVTRWTEERTFKDVAPDRKAAPVGPEDAFQRRLLACFRFDLVALRREFTVAAEALETGSRVTLVPIPGVGAADLPTLTLEFNAARQPLRVGIDEPQGNHLTFTVEEAVYDQPIDPATFTR